MFSKKKFSFYRASFLFFHALYVFQGCSSQGSAPPGSADLTIAEEKISNPLFSSAQKIKIVSPSHEAVWAYNDATLTFDKCGSTQVIALAPERLLVSENTLTNKEIIMAMKTLDTNLLTDPATIKPADLFIANNGVTTTTLFTPQSGVRYYWAVWGYSAAGDLVCSSPQYIFYLR